MRRIARPISRKSQQPAMNQFTTVSIYRKRKINSNLFS
jgi:hypothetical protein